MRMGDDGGGKIKMFQWVSKSFSSKKISKYENANHVSHKLERGCQLGFNGFNRDHDFLWNSMAFFFKQNLQI